MLLELPPCWQAPGSGAEPFCIAQGISMSKPPRSFSEEVWEHDPRVRSLLRRRQHGQCRLPPCPLLLPAAALPVSRPSCPASGMAFCPPDPAPSICLPTTAPLFSPQHLPCQGWDIAAGPRAAVGTESGTSLLLSPPLGQAPCRCPCGVLGCPQPDAEHG